MQSKSPICLNALRVQIYSIDCTCKVHVVVLFSLFDAAELEILHVKMNTNLIKIHVN